MSGATQRSHTNATVPPRRCHCCSRCRRRCPAVAAALPSPLHPTCLHAARCPRRFLIGASLNASAQNLGMLITGRIFLGLGMGAANQSVPLYLVRPRGLTCFDWLIG